MSQQQGRSRVPRAIDDGTPVEYTMCGTPREWNKTERDTPDTDMKTAIETETETETE